MKIIKKENVYKGYYQLNRLLVKSTKTGKFSELEQFATPNAVAILIYNTQKNKIVLVEQFRAGVEGQLIEIAAGKIDDKDYSPIETAKKEIIEETGYIVDSIIPIHEFYTSPGPMTEKMLLYYAEVSKQVNSGGGLKDENEEIKILHISPKKFEATSFMDAKTIIAQLYWKLLLKV